MYASLPLEIFYLRSMDVTVYLAQFESYCNAYSIKAHKTLSLFLASIGHAVLAQLRDLYSPADVTDQNFDDVKQTLITHFYSKSIL